MTWNMFIKVFYKKILTENTMKTVKRAEGTPRK